mgnify:FL=1|tara:strand:- start:159 stop:461 length:303 start_codon:yes stop_codon:yes gene_type:complete
MYKAVIPLVQGLAYAPPSPGQPDALQVVKNTYGMWNSAMTHDPSGGLAKNAAQNMLISGIVGAVIGYMLPGFKPVEGIKWGALIGGAHSVFHALTKKDTP